jgi:hypothetical protein
MDFRSWILDSGFWNVESKSSDSDTSNDLSNPKSAIRNPQSKI